MRFYFFRTGNWFWRGLAVFAVLLLAAAVAAGGVIATNYHHFGNLFKVVSLINSRYLEPVNATNLVDGAIRGVVQALGDPYSVYLDPKMFAQLEEQISGTFGGLGVLMTVKDGFLTVVRVYPGPAKEEGIVEGDRIVKINGQDARGLDLETAVSLMRGPVGSKIKLGIARKDQPAAIELEIARAQINVPTVEERMISSTRIGYLALTQFTTKTPEEVDVALERLQKQGMRGLLLDLRDNPGGELRAAVKVAGHFVPRGPVVYIDYRTGRDETHTVVNGRRLDLPLVVLVNRASASAAEILAGAIKDTHAGILVGEKTFGKGIVQELFRLDNGAGLKLTTARYLTPAKHDINKKGIEPDVVVPPGPGKEDRQLQKALEILNERLARAA